MENQDIARLRENLSQGTVSLDEITQLANEHLANNALDQAYPLVSLLTESSEVSNHTLLTAGLMALTLTKEDDATTYFERIVERESGHFDANYNLIILDLERGKISSARERLEQLIAVYPENASLLSDMAVLYAKSDNPEGALEYWQKALALDPDLELARDNAMEMCLEKGMVNEGKHLLRLNATVPGISSKSINEIKRWAEKLGEAAQTLPVDTGSEPHECPVKNKKIAVFASIDTFVGDIVEYLATDNEIRMFNEGNVEQMRRLMDWADLAWFEWCDNFIIEATKLPKTCRIVCRLHSYEAFSDMPSLVNWAKVDHLIFVNESVRNLLEQQIKITTSTTIIHNAVDGERFTIPPSKSYGKKIASVGYINYKKNPSLLLYCFKKIHEYDPEYSFHIAGQHQDPRIKLYFEHFLKENPLPVHFDGWVDDMPAWYADKDYVISTSLFESFHYSIAEGMACGLMPLIHNWYGAAGLYPEEYIFDDPDACLELLKRIEHEDRTSLAESNRRFILERYGLADKLDTIGTELARVLTGKNEPSFAGVEN